MEGAGKATHFCPYLGEEVQVEEIYDICGLRGSCCLDYHMISAVCEHAETCPEARGRPICPRLEEIYQDLLR